LCSTRSLSSGLAEVLSKRRGDWEDDGDEDDGKEDNAAGRILARHLCSLLPVLWLHLALVIVVGLRLGVRLPSKLLVFRRLADMAVSFACWFDLRSGCALPAPHTL
jgi:hypothetical protein